jgi:arginine utilization protein RocB
MQPLYKMSQDFQSVMQFLEEHDEILPEQLAALIGLETNIQDKSINIGALILNLESEDQAINEAQQKLSHRQRRTRNRIETLREYLKANLERCDISEIRSPLFDIKIKKNPCSVLIENASLLPHNFIKIEKIEKIDKEEIKKALKDGQEVAGATLKSTTRLEIK